MVDPYLLGIDLGTTTCRCAVFDLDGREVASAALEIQVDYPRPRWAEVDPDVWWQGTTRVVRQALQSGTVAPDRIAGVGLSGLMHAPVLLDAAGAPIAPAMLWMDQRCAPQCEALDREAGAPGPRAGRGFSTTLTAPKLRWLAETRPDVLARARQLLLPKDFVRFRLTGAGGTDSSDAGGTGMFDRDAGEWAWEIVRLSKIPQHLLPVVRPAWALAGGVTAAAAGETGLAPGTPVAVGGADTFCTRLGAGPLAPGEVCIYLGTAAWIAVAAGAAPNGRQVARGFGATSTTGAALRWARDLLGPVRGRWARDLLGSPLEGEAGEGRGPAGGRRSGPGPGGVRGEPTPGEGPGVSGDAADISASYDALTQEAAGVPPGAEGLLFLPHLMGERGPVADPLACGALVGLTLRHGRPHVVRAVLEGTVFQIRRLLEARAGGAGSGGVMPAAGVACGGAARSALWMQVLADVARVPLRVPAVAEAGALGAAILGGAAAGLFSIEDGQARMVIAGKAYAPRDAAAAEYDAVYARYCRLDDLLAPWFREQPSPPRARPGVPGQGSRPATGPRGGTASPRGRGAPAPPPVGGAGAAPPAARTPGPHPPRRRGEGSRVRRQPSAGVPPLPAAGVRGASPAGGGARG